MSQPVNISASRGAGILGVSKWSTPVESWLRIMETRRPGFCAANGYVLPEPPDNASIRWGKAFESPIIALAQMEKREAISDRELFYQHDKYDFITCHVDGIYDSEEIHEGKTTSYFYFKDNFGDPGTDRVPVDYQVQAQHSMLVTRFKKVILSLLVFPRRPEEWEANGWIPEKSSPTAPLWIDHILNNSIMGKLSRPGFWADALREMGYFHQYVIEANQNLQDKMIENYCGWWNDYVIGEMEPPAEGYDDFKLLVKNPVGTIIAGEETERLIAEYRDIKAEIGGSGQLAKRAEMIRVQILNFMRSMDKTLDDDSADRWILRDQQGKKLLQYKGGVLR
jgi:predicted phage-related endonuclease